MTINLHFQFGKSTPVILKLEVLKLETDAFFSFYVDDQQRRKIRETYEKVFHRKAKNFFTFHKGTAKNDGWNFRYHSRYRPKLMVPEGGNLWTNGREFRRR